jgi:hypothetical protein
MATINPFQGPINYSVDVQSPFEAAIGGFKLGAAGAEAQAQAQVREQAKKAQTELATLFKNPNATAADYERVLPFLSKDQAAIVTQGFDRKTKEQQQNSLQLSAQVYAALKSGQPDIAKNLLTEQAKAFRNSGREPDAKATETYLQMIDLNPTGSLATIGIMMASLPGGKELLENVDKTSSTGRAEALAPQELRQKIAAADEAVAAATTAQATATNAAEQAAANAALARAQSDKAKVDAQYAERNALADLKKKAADLKLTRAQTDSALTQGKKFGAEASAALLELEALKKGGALATPKAFEQEEKIRKEWQLRTKVFGELQGTFNTLKASSESANGPGDIALITGFMKMLDPGSVVRETEFATARDTAGQFTQLKNMLEKAQNGQLLRPTQRKEYVALAQKYLDSAQKKADEDKEALGVVVKNYRLNPENVFGPEPAAVPNSVTVGGKTYTRPANFTDDQWSAYKQSMGAQ